MLRHKGIIKRSGTMNYLLQKFSELKKHCVNMLADNQKKQESEEQIYFLPISLHDKYNQKIRPLLINLSTQKLTNNQVINKLQQFLNLTLIHKEQLQTEFKQLKSLKQDIGPLFSKMAEYVIKQEQKFGNTKIKILLQSKNDEINLDKEEMLYLMSLMALNLVPCQEYNKIKQNLNAFKKRRRFPYPYTFAHIFSEEEYKTKTVIEYFKQTLLNENWKDQKETFTIKRKYIAQRIQAIIEKNKNSPMAVYELKSDTTSIEQFTGHVKVDFANKYIGGGALSSGCVQQEIMFANHPELFTSVMFCEVMNNHEAIFFSGFRKYSKNKGYGWKTQYDGQEKISENFYKQNQYIVAIDALHFPSDKDITQVKKQNINRELKKAFVGFSDLPQNCDIVTGNWGCGAFNGDIRMKFMIQWLACSLAKKKMIYCPFGHRQKITESQIFLKSLEKKNVGQVYQALIKGGAKMKKMDQNIFSKMKQQL